MTEEERRETMSLVRTLEAWGYRRHWWSDLWFHPTHRISQASFEAAWEHCCAHFLVRYVCEANGD